MSSTESACIDTGIEPGERRLSVGSARNYRAPAAQSSEQSLTTIRPVSAWQWIDWSEIWRYRELLYFLTWRDIKVRYKQSVLGAAWALLQPLATMIVFSLFFGRIGQLPSGGIPYPVFVLTGLLPWFFFSNAISNASTSVVGNQNLVTKVYFPRLLIPMSAVCAGLVDFGISFGLLAVVILLYGATLSMQLMMLPVLVVLLVIAALGIGILLSALTVAFRDVRHVVPFMIQLWIFLTPTIYMHGNERLSEWLQLALPLNPVYGLIVNFRVAILGGSFDWYALTVSSGVSLLLLLVGCWYFNRTERNFADVI